MLKKMLGNFFDHPIHLPDNFTLIPKDILYSIFIHLNLEDISALNKTCKRLYYYTNTDACWMQLFHSQMNLPIAISSYKEMYKNIYQRMEFIFDRKGNYQFLFRNNLLDFEHINEQLNKYILPKKNQQLCFLLDESLNDQQRIVAAKASSYIYADQNNPWRKEFILDKWFIDNIQVLNRGIKYIEQCAVLIIYTNEIKTLNKLLQSIKEKYKKSTLPFLFIITFNSKILAEDIPYPLIQLTHLCSKRKKSIFHEFHSSSYSLNFQKIWYDISTCIAALMHTKKNLEDLAIEPKKFVVLPKEFFLELGTVSDCRIS